MFRKSGTASAAAPPAPLLTSLRQLAGTGLGIVQTRLALAGLELEEEIQRILGALILALAMVLFVALALLVFTLMIVLAFHDENREIAAGVMCVLYLVIAGAIGLRLKRIFALRPPIFEATLAELEKDRAMFSRQVSVEPPLAKDAA